MARTDGAADDEAPLNTELQRSEADEPIKLSLAAAAAAGAGKAGAAAARPTPAQLFGDDDGECLLIFLQPCLACLWHELWPGAATHASQQPFVCVSSVAGKRGNATGRLYGLFAGPQVLLQVLQSFTRY